MKEHLTRSSWSSRKISSYSPIELQVYKSLCKQIHERYPYPSAKVNRKYIRTSIAKIAERTHLDRAAVRRAMAMLHRGGVIGHYKTRTYGMMCVYIRQTRYHKERPIKTRTCRLTLSNASETKENKNQNAVSQIFQEERKKEKGVGRGGDSTRPSTLPSEVNRAVRPPLSSPQCYRSKKHPLYYADAAGLHCVLPGASRAACPTVWTFSEFEGLLGRLVQFGRDTWHLPRLDRKVLTEKNHLARKLVLRYAMKSYQGQSGPPTERRAVVEQELRNVVLGNYQDHLERKKAGWLKGTFAELSDVFSLKNGTHMERKKWCTERGKQTVNENWTTRDRPVEEGKKALARMKARDQELAGVTKEHQMSKVRALLAGLPP